MTLAMPRIAARVFNAPLLVSPDKAAAFLTGLGGRIVGEDQVFVFDGFPATIEHKAFAGGRIAAGTVGGRLERGLEAAGRRPYAMVDNVAVIGVEGTLVHKGAYVGQSSGETSCEGLQAQIAMAGRDPTVRAVVFEHDSLGGEAAGVAETAEMIHRLSAQKPTMAILTDFSCSAAYWLASASRQIVMPEMGVAGSIGAIIVHLDMSAAAEKAGVTVTMIRSGEQKGGGHPLTPLSDDARRKMQARVDQARDQFAAAVGRYRGRRFDKAKALATEAEIFTGPDALRLGLVDAVGAPNDAFAAFRAAVARS